jgi:hypothetical protein
MIQINCTQCRELLQIDDAFAGGVCRCKFCGAIQTVPKRLKGANGDEFSEASAGGATTAVKRLATDAPSGTGLDDLAGIVASSGLTSGRLQGKQPTQPKSSTKVTAAKRVPPSRTKTAAAAQAQQQRNLIIAGAVGGVVAVLLGVIIFLALRDKSAPAEASITNPADKPHVIPTPDPPSPGPDHKEPLIPPVAPVRGPSFLGHAIRENSVVYIIDRGQASASEHRLDLAKRAVAASLKSLGPNKRFALMFWRVQGDHTGSWPINGLQNATPENVNAAIKELDQVYAAGQTKPPIDLDKAFASGAEAILYVPLKSFAPESLAEPVRKARGGSKARVYPFTIEIGTSDIADPMRRLAHETGGAYHDVSLAEARALPE